MTGTDTPSDLRVDRDLGWLEFNRRVLAEAEDARTPLLERLKYLAIFTSNLDEFFMKRIAGLRDEHERGRDSGQARFLKPARRDRHAGQRATRVPCPTAARDRKARREDSDLGRPQRRAAGGGDGFLHAP